MTRQPTRPTCIGRVLLWAATLLMIAAGTLAAGASFLPVYEHGVGRLEVDLAIGNEDEDDYVLYAPWQIAVDAAGNVFVLDSKMHHIKKFAPDGGFIRTFSRPGEGPGELGQSGKQMAITPAGHIVVYDYSNQRVTEFDNDGEYVGDVKFHSWMTNLQCTPDGSFYVEVSDIDWEDFSSSVLRVSHYSAEFELIAHIDSARVRTQLTERTGDGMRSIGLPYTNGFVWVVAPDGNLVIGRADEYRLRVVSPDQGPVRVLTRDVPRVKTTGEDRDRFVEDMTEGFRDLARKVEFPRHKPYIAALLCDHEGNVLVCRYDEDDSNTRYDVFLPDGDFISEVMLPRIRKMKVLKHGFVYGAKTFEEQLPQVRRYRLVPGTQEDIDQEDV